MAGASKAIRVPKPVAYKKLLVAHTNACSLVPKLGEVNILINSFSVDILCITETWLNYDVTDAEVSFGNYNIFLGDRQSGRRGGGVALYVESELLPRCFSFDFNTDSSFAPTHPNYSPYSEYTEAQPLRKLMANKSSVPSALSPVNRAFVLSLEILTLHTSIGRQACAQPQMVSL